MDGVVDLSGLVPERYWDCPNCDLEHITREPLPHTPFHPCAGLKGLTAPFVEAGVRAKVERVEWGDYVGREQVHVDDEGRPASSIITTRDDGQDCAVLAPAAGIGTET